MTKGRVGLAVLYFCNVHSSRVRYMYIKERRDDAARTPVRTTHEYIHSEDEQESTQRLHEGNTQV